MVVTRAANPWPIARPTVNPLRASVLPTVKPRKVRGLPTVTHAPPSVRPVEAPLEANGLMLPVTLRLLAEARGLMPRAMLRPTGLLVEGAREVNVLRPRVTPPPAGVAAEAARVPSEAALVGTTGPALALPAAAVPPALDRVAAVEAAHVVAEAGADDLFELRASNSCLLASG